MLSELNIYLYTCTPGLTVADNLLNGTLFVVLPKNSSSQLSIDIGNKSLLTF